MSKHTPTPYRIGKNGAVVSDEPVIGMPGSDAVDYYGGHCVAESVTPENAAFIVRACNSHYELLAASRECITAIDKVLTMAQQHNPETGFLKPVDPYKILEALQTAGICVTARAAIAKAEGAECSSK